jgi:HEAT repeat protein
VVVVLFAAFRAAEAAGSPADRERATLLVRIGESRYRLSLLRPGGGDLSEALRALDEARELDPANLRALGYLGLARVEAGARGMVVGARVDAFGGAREVLEELFRLSSGWVDSETRGLLDDVTVTLDRAFGGERAAPANARAWWRAWKARLVQAEGAARAADDLLPAVEALRGAPVAWERERAVEKLAGRKPASPDAVEALALALRGDASPWVRAAAAKALAALGAAGWEVRLAEGLLNDAAVWVRRTCAEGLGRGKADKGVAVARRALVAALEKDTPRVSAAAASALGGLGGAEAELVRALESGSALVRGAASVALERHSDSATIAAKLRPLMDSATADVRAGALRALGSGPGRLPGEMREKVGALLADADARVRCAAAKALWVRDVSGLRGRLRDLLADDAPSVRLAAAETLVRAGDDSARAVLRKLADSRAPLHGFGPGDGMRTVGEAAKRVLAELDEKGQPPSAPLE